MSTLEVLENNEQIHQSYPHNKNKYETTREYQITNGIPNQKTHANIIGIQMPIMNGRIVYAIQRAKNTADILVRVITTTSKKKTIIPSKKEETLNQKRVKVSTPRRTLPLNLA